MTLYPFLSQKTDSFVNTLSFIKDSSFDQEDEILHLATWFLNLVTEDEIFLQSCAKRYGINDSRKDNRSCYKSRNLQMCLHPEDRKIMTALGVSEISASNIYRITK